MLRWGAAVGAAVMIAIAAYFLWSSPRAAALPVPSAVSPARAVEAAAVPLPVAESVETPADREARRLKRYDKDKDGSVDQTEYLTARHKNFDKLDLDHDGKLSFAEYAARAIEKFDGADQDKSGKLSAQEFATTATTHKAPSKAACPPTAEADN